MSAQSQNLQASLIHDVGGSPKIMVGKIGGSCAMCVAVMRSYSYLAMFCRSVGKYFNLFMSRKSS